MRPNNPLSRTPSGIHAAQQQMLTLFLAAMLVMFLLIAGWCAWQMVRGLLSPRGER